jgi:hypothetical protein
MKEPTYNNQPKQAKGGVFAPADMALLKRALRCYKDKLVNEVEITDRGASPELMKVANLLHRLGRID